MYSNCYSSCRHSYLGSPGYAICMNRTAINSSAKYLKQNLKVTSVHTVEISLFESTGNVDTRRKLLMCNTCSCYEAGKLKTT